MNICLSILTFVLGAQKNRLVETVLLSIHNMFWLRYTKNIKLINFDYSLLSTSIFYSTNTLLISHFYFIICVE